MKMTQQEIKKEKWNIASKKYYHSKKINIKKEEPNTEKELDNKFLLNIHLIIKMYSLFEEKTTEQQFIDFNNFKKRIREGKKFGFGSVGNGNMIILYLLFEDLVYG